MPTVRESEAADWDGLSVAAGGCLWVGGHGEERGLGGRHWPRLEASTGGLEDNGGLLPVSLHHRLEPGRPWPCLRQAGDAAEEKPPARTGF